eukprot:TRINITY_DN225_c0_g1_i12.p1 TRINITY_DN225_c0_g1~~TRINITY_DN225_c0_g1_i12.p1  ORF type:complete len:413 (-),score=89.04 TRINITY_DN225_c0_g1_i12:147-1385(-)
MLVFTENRTQELKTLIEEWEGSGALVVSLIDVSQGETTSAVTTVHRIYFTSPHKDILRNHTRTQNPGGAYDVYIDLWQEGDLVNLATDVYNVHVDSVKTRIKTYGLDARVACCTLPEDNPKSAVYRAKERLDIALCDKSFHGALLKYLKDGQHQSLPIDIGQTLLHITTGPNERQWASEYVKERVAQKLLENCMQDVFTALSKDLGGGTKGELVEKLWFEMFVRMATVKSEEHRNMDVKYCYGENCADALRDALKTYTDCERQPFWTADIGSQLKGVVELMKQADWSLWKVILLTPREHNTAVFDGVMLLKLSDGCIWVLLLQATTAERHPVDGADATKFLKAVVEAATKAGAVCSLVFIVPSFRFQIWKKQKCADDISQYAVELGGGSNISTKRANRELEEWNSNKKPKPG